MEEMELSEFLESDGQPEDFQGTEQTYVLMTDEDALWAMRRLANSQRRIDEKHHQAAAEQLRIDSWFLYATKSDRATVEYFTGILESYMKRVREEDGSKSLSFPDGNVTSTATQDKVSVDDPELFLKWAEQNGHREWTRTKTEPDMSAIKSSVKYHDESVIDTVTGEVIEGLSHVAGSISVKVKVVE